MAANMATTKRTYGEMLDQENLDRAFGSLALRLDGNRADHIELVVCGGSALIMTGLVVRTTRDVDVVALIQQGVLCSPDPLPSSLQQAIREVAEDLDLSPDWLNNGPSRGDGGLFQMGLPEGFASRLRCRQYGERLAVHFAHRFDQIHFKLYAAADRGGYHIADLLALKPVPDEIEAAARWTMTHDVSEGFAMVLKQLIGDIGYAAVADRL